MHLLIQTCILAFFLAYTSASWSQKIVYPWRATTAIVKSGGFFEVWFQSDKEEVIRSVNLKTEWHSTATQFTVEKGNWIYDSTSQNNYNTLIKVSVPDKTAADRYDLIVETTAGQSKAPAAVKVIQNYQDSYYILHFPDIHAFQNGYPNTLNKLSTLVAIANIINPEIVFNTGDDLYRPTEERMNALFDGNQQSNLKGLNQLNAATFTVVGNHDFDFDTLPEIGVYTEKSKWWNRWWGLQAYNFTYNQGRFMVINDAWEGFNPSVQIAEATTWLQKNGEGNFRLGSAHIKDSELLDLEKNTHLSLVLVGHNHHIANQNPRFFNGKTNLYISNSMRDNFEFNLYKVNTKTGIFTTPSGPTAQVHYLKNTATNDSPDSYQSKLKLEFAQANNGTALKNTATLTNDFHFKIENSRVRFIMPKGYKYTLSEGTIVQAFDGDKVHIVDVDITLESNTIKNIVISPSTI